MRLPLYERSQISTGLGHQPLASYPNIWGFQHMRSPRSLQEALNDFVKFNGLAQFQTLGAWSPQSVHMYDSITFHSDRGSHICCSLYVFRGTIHSNIVAWHARVHGRRIRIIRGCKGINSCCSQRFILVSLLRGTRTVVAHTVSLAHW